MSTPRNYWLVAFWIGAVLGIGVMIAVNLKVA